MSIKVIIGCFIKQEHFTHAQNDLVFALHFAKLNCIAIARCAVLIGHFSKLI